MGIKDLLKTIKKQCPDIVTPIDDICDNRKFPLIDKENGSIRIQSDKIQKKTYLMDVSCYLYVYAYSQSPSYFINIINKILEYKYKYHIEIHCVFDGVADKMKQEHAKKKRKESMSKSLKKHEIDPLKYKPPIRIKKTDVEYLKLLLNHHGLIYFESKHETDHYLSYLLEKYPNVYDGILTNDSDILIHPNVSCVIFFIFNSNRSCFWIDCRDLYKKLGFKNKKQLIDYCILCGCDYTGTMKSIGPITSMQIMKKYNSIEDWLIYSFEGQKYVNKTIGIDLRNFKHVKNQDKFIENLCAVLNCNFIEARKMFHYDPIIYNTSNLSS